MSAHEKHLLFGIIIFLFTAIFGLIIATLILEESPVFLIKNLRISWAMITIFLIIGSIGSYYELTAISAIIQITEAGKYKWPINYRYVLGMGVTLSLGLLLIGLVIYGTDKISLLEGAYNITIAGLGFSFALGIMFISAIIARVRRN